MNDSMKIRKIGEFGLIDLIRGMVGSTSGVIKGIGDDCAVLPFDRQNYLLLTCDMLIEDADFTRQDRLYSVGRKSLGCCLSDIAACGGLPNYAQISLGLSPDMLARQVRELYQGIIAQAKEFGVRVVGGDISRSKKLIIDVNLVGRVERRNLTLRQGARKKDIIFVSGKLGGSSQGRHLLFRPRVKEARYLVKNYKINSMIDISDGLVQDLGHILKQSRQGAVIFRDLIPLNAKAGSFDEALYMGEDFELLFTLALPEARRLIRSRQNMKFFPIGEIVDRAQGLVLLDKQARRIRLKAGGFKHF